MMRSYSSLEQGHGSGTVHRGTPEASACRSTRVRRTACIATRSNAWLIVVSSPDTCMPCRRNTCIVQALSLPLLHESRILGMEESEHKRREEQVSRQHSSEKGQARKVAGRKSR